MQDECCGVGDGFVLPDSDDGPPFGFEARVGVAITRDVRGEFVRPPLGVVARFRRMNGAAVPEAAIDVHGNLSARKNNVGPTPHTLQRGTVDEISQAEPVQFSSKRNLGLGVASPLLAQPRTRSGIGDRSPHTPTLRSPLAVFAVLGLGPGGREFVAALDFAVDD